MAASSMNFHVTKWNADSRKPLMLTEHFFPNTFSEMIQVAVELSQDADEWMYVTATMERKNFGYVAYDFERGKLVEMRSKTIFQTTRE